MGYVDEETELTDIDHIAVRLEDEAPWDTCSKVLSHQGWIDVVTTIKATCPDAYRQMQLTYLGRQGDLMGYDYSFSNSKLILKRDCRRCFYDVNKLKIERPESIFASITTGVDRIIKEYQDQYRGNLTPELKNRGLTGEFWGTQEQIKKLRHWKSGLQAELLINGKTVRVIGALDDLIQEFVDRTFSPHDTKTKGDIPKDDGAKYYQLQGDIYGLLLDRNGMTPSGKAYFQYWYPTKGPSGHIRFEDDLKILTVDPQRAIDDITDAVTLLEGEQPLSDPACTYCRFADARAIQGVATAVKGMVSK